MKTLWLAGERASPKSQPPSLSSAKSASSVGERCMGTGGEASLRAVILLSAFLPYTTSLGATCGTILALSHPPANMPDPAQHWGEVDLL